MVPNILKVRVSLFFFQIISSDIERQFLMDKETESARVIRFSNKQFTYDLNFRKKVQKNLDPRYRTERQIRRRPIFSRLIFNYKVSSFLVFLSAILVHLDLSKWSNLVKFTSNV